MTTAYLINHDGATKVELPHKDKLKKMYELIGCRVVSAFSWELNNGKEVSIYIDDESLLSSGDKLLTMLHGADVPVVGNILVLGECDDNGLEISAPEDFKEDQLVLEKRMVTIQA